MRTKSFYIFILQIFFICTLGFASADEFKDNVKKAGKIKGYNVSALEYEEEKDKFSAKFKDGSCDIFVSGYLKNGVYRRAIEVSSPSSDISKKCFESFNKHVLAKSFAKDRTHLIKQQEESISEDYTFSHFQEDSYGGYLKSEAGSIRFMLYDCPLDGTNCANLHKETMNY